MEHGRLLYLQNLRPKQKRSEDRKTDKDKNERKHMVERFYDGCDVFGQVTLRELIIVWTAFELIYIELRDDRTDLCRQMAVQPLKTLCYLLILSKYAISSDANAN